jgi:hypothetical protein
MAKAVPLQDLDLFKGSLRRLAMELLVDAMNGMGVILLPVATGLLLEELTFGGLVRLLLAPRPGTRGGARRKKSSSSARGCGEPMNKTEVGGARCSH